MKVIDRKLKVGTPYLLLILFLLTNCTGGLRKHDNAGPLLVPAGVDSTIAQQADSLADGLFVSLDREARANQHKKLGKAITTKSDTLWRCLTNELDPSFQVDQDEKNKAVEAFNKGAVSLQELAKLDQSNPNAFTRVKILNLLLEARKNFERAVILNPFDLETKSWLARVYQTLAVRFMDENNHKKAAAVLENLVRLEQGEHTLFARLAEAYYAMAEWQDAYFNFGKAESVLYAAAGLVFSAEAEINESAAIDTAALFYYVYYQGDSQIKMHDAAKGLADLRRALLYAATAKERNDINSYIEWINWDDGNIRAVEKRDKYLTLQEEGEYNKAAKGFLTLIPQLKTRRAIDEVVWRLAVLEFQYLNRQNEGIDRLKHVIQLAPKNTNGAPVDSTYRRYFDSYGVMCYNLGLENIKKNRKFSFVYFQQAAAIAWGSRAKSFLEIAKLSRNNPQSVIASCESALAYPEQLDELEQMQLYQLLVEGCKRSGKFNEARKYYAQWMQMRKNARRASR